MMEQLSFAPNGNIMPCPYREQCLNHPAGCSGVSHWCKRIPDEKEKAKWRKKMIKPEAYHFHKDCAYYDQCEIKEDRVDGHNVIRFKCPALNHADMYYKNDFETIKWECAKFVPRQQSIFDY